MQVLCGLLLKFNKSAGTHATIAESDVRKYIPWYDLVLYSVESIMDNQEWLTIRTVGVRTSQTVTIITTLTSCYFEKYTETELFLGRPMTKKKQ